MTERTSLYRHFAADGSLLYVGVSKNYASRTAQHQAASKWFWDVSRIDVEHFSTRAEALAAERAAIQYESPVHNVKQPGPKPELQPDMFQLLRLKLYWHGPFDRADAISQAKDIMGRNVSAHMLNRALGPRHVSLAQRLAEDDTPKAMAERSRMVAAL